MSVSNSSDFRVSQHCHTYAKSEGWSDLSFKCSRNDVVAQFMKIEVENNAARIALYEVIVLGWDV